MQTPAEFRIELSSDFREPPRSSLGYQGRSEELSHLRHIIKHRESGSILISGPRGVGKTAFVREALATTKPKPPVVVYLNLPMALSKPGTEIRKQVLLSLIRGLAYAVPSDKKMKNLQKSLKSAHEKSELSDLEEHKIIGSLVETRNGIETTKSQKITFSPHKALVAMGSSFFGAMTALTSMAAYLLGFGQLGAVAALIPAAFVLSVGLISLWAVERTRASTESSEEKSGSFDTSSRVGRYDLSDDALEAELLQVLQAAKDVGVRPVFVLDELDKIPEASERDTITHLLFSLKNLFTLQNAVFLFITSERFYRQHWETITNSPYTEDHTIFTERIFIPMLYYRDAEALVDRLLLKKASLNDDSYRMLRNFLVWQSLGHPYDLLAQINEFVVYDKGKCFFWASESGVVAEEWKQGNLPLDWRTKAGLQKFVGATYDRFSRRGYASSVFNHSLWLALSLTAHELAEVQTYEYSETSEEFDLEDHLTLGLTEDESEDIKGSIQQMLALMERFGICSYEVGDTDQEETGSSSNVYLLSSKVVYPPREISKYSATTPSERMFLELVRHAEEVSDNVKDCEVDLEAYESDLENLYGARRVILATGQKRSLPRHVLMEKFREGDEILEEIAEISVDSIISTWASEKGLTTRKKSSEKDVKTGAPLNGAVPDYKDFFLKLDEEADVRYLLSSETDNRAIVVLNLENVEKRSPAELYSAAKPGKKGGEERKVKLPIIEVRRKVPGVTADVPTELVNIMEEVDRRSWFWTAFNPPNKELVRRKIEGWYIFELDEKCENLADLDDLLNEVTYFS